jgi:[acyl-carrier-protein] S-malonyltransferase
VAPTRLGCGAVTRTGDLALLFPGQGSQVEGMRDEVARVRPDLLALALAEVGDDPFARTTESTRFAQPAIFCASVAALSRAPLESARWMAGHSLGEFAALVAAGSIGAHDGLRLVALRGRLMDEVAGNGGMLALVGDGADELAAEIGLGTGAYVANRNAPTQVVMAGTDEAIAAAARIARNSGLRSFMLPVRGAFHTPLTEAARAPFEAALAEVDVARPRVPVISSVTAAPFDDIRRRLAEALTAPVRWHDTVEALAAAGARRFVEVGPGSVLTKLVRRSAANVEATALAGPRRG